jgi:hypothetical protein
MTHCVFFYVVFVFVRRPLSPSIEGQGLVNESKNSGGRLFVNWFFQRGKKKDSALCHLVRGNAFVLGSVTMAGRERKSFVGAFKAQNSGREAGIEPAAPLSP